MATCTDDNAYKAVLRTGTPVFVLAPGVIVGLPQVRDGRHLFWSPPMAIKWMSDVLQHSPQRGTAKLVLMAIADKADEHGEAYPSNAYLARICNVSPRQIQLSIDKLLAAEELVIVDAGGRGPKDTRRVRIRVKSTSSMNPTSSMKSSADKGEAERNKGEAERTKRVKSTSPDTSIDTSKDTSEDTSRARAREKVPQSFEDVEAYATEIGLSSLEAEKFWNHFESNGWVVGRGRAPMRDWRAALRNWKTRQPEFTPRGGKNGEGPDGPILRPHWMPR